MSGRRSVKREGRTDEGIGVGVSVGVGVCVVTASDGISIIT